MSSQARRDPRAKILSMTVRHRSASVDEFIENHSHDISRGGMFINTTTPFPPGTLLKFEVRIAGERRVLQGVGRVLWKRETPGPSELQPAGMGIKFIKIDAETRDIIDRLVSNRPDTKATFETGAQTAGIDLNPASMPGPTTPRTVAGWPKPRPTQIGLGAVRLEQSFPPNPSTPSPNTDAPEPTVPVNPVVPAATLPPSSWPEPIPASPVASSATLPPSSWPEPIPASPAASPNVVPQSSTPEPTPVKPILLSSPTPQSSIPVQTKDESALTASLSGNDITPSAAMATMTTSSLSSKQVSAPLSNQVGEPTPKQVTEPLPKVVPASEALTSRPPSVALREERAAASPPAEPAKKPPFEPVLPSVSRKASHYAVEPTVTSSQASTSPNKPTAGDALTSQPPTVAKQDAQPKSDPPAKDSPSEPRASRPTASVPQENPALPSEAAAAQARIPAPQTAIVRSSFDEVSKSTSSEASNAKAKGSSSPFLWGALGALAVVGLGFYLLFVADDAKPGESPADNAPPAPSPSTAHIAPSEKLAPATIPSATATASKGGHQEIGNPQPSASTAISAPEPAPMPSVTAAPIATTPPPAAPSVSKEPAAPKKPPAKKAPVYKAKVYQPPPAPTEPPVAAPSPAPAPTPTPTEAPSASAPPKQPKLAPFPDDNPY